LERNEEKDKAKKNSNLSERTHKVGSWFNALSAIFQIGKKFY
jgi:hypothetical protein